MMAPGQKGADILWVIEYALAAGPVQPRHTDCGTFDVPKSVYCLTEHLVMEAPAAGGFRLAGMRGRLALAVVSSSGKGRGVGARLVPNLPGWRQFDSILTYKRVEMTRRLHMDDVK